ncbi:hypothetical protein [Aquimarina intermedia]|uniref:Uncharacterized protein n=1 Tax=Aquimarina intermedia TaxID=350814 RepID=A0A5S5C2J2_9FLAO|nr:hypothetical protein [Aquimarina intermedia]TYP72828.1 hypothetical protein BD809_10676 [Aquimarina intermedia]
MEPTHHKQSNGVATGCIMLIVLFIIIIVTSIVTQSNSKEILENNYKKNTKSHSKTKALLHSQPLVIKKLKIPSSAIFGESIEHVTIINDSTFRVINYVDSQTLKAFTTRNYYSCTVIFANDGKIYSKDLIFIE